MTQSFDHPIRVRQSRFNSAARLVALAAVLMFAGLFAAMPTAHANTPAEAFVQTNIERGMKILNNKTLTEAQRRDQFRNFLIGMTDIRRTALFTLGAARRTATPTEINTFVDAFRDYAIAVYQTRLSAYSGQTLRVTGSTERAPGDYVVTTELVDPSNSGDQQPIQVDFRVDRDKGHFVVLDASVVGVWLAIEERDQFTAFLAQHNNSVTALAQHLKALATNLQDSGNQTAKQ